MRIFIRSVKTFFWYFLMHSVMGQVPKAPATLPSPNAASLGLYGDVPVSLFTGVPQIQIPFFSLQEGPLSVPLSLSYHAAGFRPDQHPGWVGAGWNLNAGGAITRIVKDLPDDHNRHIEKDRPLGYYFNGFELNVDHWNTKDYLKTLNTTGNLFLRSAYDTEPDEFSFNFLGYSGKFYLDHLGNWKVMADKKIAVSLIPHQSDPVRFEEPLSPPFMPPSFSAWRTGDNKNGYIASFSGFVITDEDGTKYVFGGGTDAIEYSINFFSQDKDVWLANTWYLTKIINPADRQISFSYERGDFINDMSISVTMRNTKAKADSFNDFLIWVSSGLIGSNDFLTPSCFSANSVFPASGQFAGRLIAPVYLKEITSSNGTARFINSESKELRYEQGVYEKYRQWYLTNGGNLTSDMLCFLYDNYGMGGGNDRYPQVLEKLKWRKLNRIEIYNKDDLQNPARKFEFIYNNTFADKPTARLRLEKFGEVSLDPNEIIPAYEFTYEPFPASEPVYLQNQNDHWGFFNGVYATLENNTDAINFQNYTAKRNPNPAYLLGGTLNKIVYPTGGTTFFSFQPHTYSQEIAYSQESTTSSALVPLLDDQVAGGLRIAKITSIAHNATEKMEKKYYYINNYDPETGFSGRSSGILGARAQYYWDGYKTRNSDDNITYTEAIFSTQSVLPMSENSMGSHIGYSEVVEVATGGHEALQNNGITVYKFSNFDNGHLDEPFFATLQETRSPFEPNNSKALERGHLLSTKVYDASGRPMAEDTYQYAALNQDHIRALKVSATYLCRSDNKILEGTAYKINVYQYKPVIHHSYLYSYAAGNQQKSIHSTTTFSYNTHGQLAQRTIRQSNGREKIITYKYPHSQSLISNLSAVAATALGKMREINMLPLIEKQESTATNGGTLLTRYNYRVENSKVVPDNIQESQGDENKLETRYNFHSYDVSGNLLEESKTGDLHSVTLWGYNKTLPIARVTNASYGSLIPNIFHTSFEDILSSEVVTGNAKTGIKSFNGSYLIYLPSQSGSYDLSWWSRPVNSEEWAYNKQTITVSNGEPTTISIGNSLENIDEVRLCPTDAQMTTYTYAPLLGMTSLTDVQGNTIYYEYDALGRLKHIKDDKGNIIKRYDYKFVSH